MTNLHQPFTKSLIIPRHEGKIRIRFYDIYGRKLSEDYIWPGEKIKPPKNIPDIPFSKFHSWSWPYDTAYYDIDIGAIYETEDKLTHIITHTLEWYYRTRCIIEKQHTDEFFIDWGDGNITTIPKEDTGTFTFQHYYEVGKSYHIVLGYKNDREAPYGLYFSGYNQYNIVFLGNGAQSMEIDAIYISLPPNLETIPQYYLTNSSIRYVNLPSTVTYIERCAFSNCWWLKRICMPPHITFEDEVFEECNSLEGQIIVNNLSAWLFYACHNLTNVIFQCQPEVIPKGCFDECFSLTIPSYLLENVKKIEDYAFSNCPNVPPQLPPYVEEIGRYAYYSYYFRAAYYKLEFPPTVKKIGQSAFYNAKVVVFKGPPPELSQAKHATNPYLAPSFIGYLSGPIFVTDEYYEDYLEHPGIKPTNPNVTERIVQPLSHFNKSVWFI